MAIISIGIILLAMVNLVNGQISTPCTTSMISTFTPCANYITGSTNNNGATPSNTCCDSLISLISTSMDCACLIFSANAPILPANFIIQALAQACNINGVTAQCKASGSPLPAPGPAILGSNGPATPPITNFPTSPQGSKMQWAASTEDEEAEPPSNPPLSSPSHPSYVVSISPFALFLFIGLVLSATY